MPSVQQIGQDVTRSEVGRLPVESLREARVRGAQLLARSAVHEINNALSPALMSAELLAEWEGLPPEAQMLASRIMASVRRAAEKVQAMHSLTSLVEEEWPGLEPTVDLLASTAA